MSLINLKSYKIALAGNPNTGKSTVFNGLTGLKQHTGNWPGKTVAKAEGMYSFNNTSYRLIDLPGTYSLLSNSPEEEIARNYILFSKPDAIVVVVDATSLERNLNLVLQILEISNKVVICLNLMDEAKRKGIQIDSKELSRQLGVPVVETIASRKAGFNSLVKEIEKVADSLKLKIQIQHENIFKMMHRV